MRALFALIVLAAAAVGAPALAQSRPDFTGVWMIREEYYLGQPYKTEPRLTPAVAERAKKRMAAMTAGYVRDVSGMICGQAGGPIMYQIRSPFEIFAGFGRMTLMFETEMNNQPRTIYMDQAAHPDALYPTFNGHSIGRWEGQALVVDTVGFVPRGGLLGDVPRTAQSHTVERFTLSPDGKAMTLEMTLEDPSSLIEPWTTSFVFDRKPTTEERFEVWCDFDKSAYEATDLQSLKDVDPEVALLLEGVNDDPATRIAKEAAAAN